MNGPNGDSSKLVELLREKVRLDPWHRRAFYFSFGTIWLTGVLWLISEWQKQPELGPVRTSWQSLSMQIHGAAALLFLIFLGTMMPHVRRGWNGGNNRWSGATIIAISATLALTAWLLYYVTGDRWRELSNLIHWAVGLSALPMIGMHVWCGRRTRRD